MGDHEMVRRRPREADRPRTATSPTGARPGAKAPRAGRSVRGSAPSGRAAGMASEPFERVDERVAALKQSPDSVASARPFTDTFIAGSQVSRVQRSSSGGVRDVEPPIGSQRSGPRGKIQRRTDGWRETSGGEAAVPVTVKSTVGQRQAMRSSRLVQRTFDGDLKNITVDGLLIRLKEKGIAVPYKEVRETYNKAVEEQTVFTTVDQLIETYGLGATPPTQAASLPPSSAFPDGVRQAIRSASEIAHAEAIQQVSAKQAKNAESTQTAEPSASKRHTTVKAGGTALIINNVWLGDGKLGPLERFNLFSWRALGHSVNIFAHRFDGKEPTLAGLGLEEGDAEVISLSTVLNEDRDAESDTPAGSFGTGRAILKSWLSHPRSENEDVRRVHTFNLVDLTKSYIGGTRRGIVLDMKVGPSLHLEDYAPVFFQKMISYTRGGQTLGPENQSVGTMQESDELRKRYAESFNKALRMTMKDQPEDTWFNLLTATHGRSYVNTKKWLDTAAELPSGKVRPTTGSPYSVSEPGSSPGHGPFRVFKDATDQTNKDVKFKTKPSQVKKLATNAVEDELRPSGVDQAFLEKARQAMEALPA